MISPSSHRGNVKKLTIWYAVKKQLYNGNIGKWQLQKLWTHTSLFEKGKNEWRKRQWKWWKSDRTAKKSQTYHELNRIDELPWIKAKRSFSTRNIITLRKSLTWDPVTEFLVFFNELYEEEFPRETIKGKVISTKRNHQHRGVRTSELLHWRVTSRNFNTKYYSKDEENWEAN